MWLSKVGQGLVKGRRLEFSHMAHVGSVYAESRVGGHLTFLDK